MSKSKKNDKHKNLPNKTANLNIRVSEQFYDEFSSYANDIGANPSSLARQWLIRCLNKEKHSERG